MQQCSFVNVNFKWVLMWRLALQYIYIMPCSSDTKLDLIFPTLYWSDFYFLPFSLGSWNKQQQSHEMLKIKIYVIWLLWHFSHNMSCNFYPLSFFAYLQTASHWCEWFNHRCLMQECLHLFHSLICKTVEAVSFTSAYFQLQ